MRFKKICFVLLFCFGTGVLIGQKKKVVYTDTLGNAIDFIESLSILNTGRYTWNFDESDKKTRYIRWKRTTEREFDSLVVSTRTRSAIRDKVGVDFKFFGDVRDINGKSYKETELKGKVIVINFWFVGCGPCEVEMPELNKLKDKYKNSQDIIFISFAKSSEAKIRKFLMKKSFTYPVVVMSKESSAEFKIAAYPTNYIVDKDGKFQYASRGIGVGGVHILDKEIELAVKK